ncbi:MAG: class I SAM-dependent methyltransferase [Promethearchaeati archaeon SRVP18_Atabeyarchaeia-1]
MPVNSSRESEIKREVRSTFDFISDDYDKLRSRIWEDLTEFTEEHLFSPELNKDDVVLDLACGNARHAIYIAGKHQLRCVAIDFSLQLLRHARYRVNTSRLERMVAVINGDASNIPLRTESVNGVLYVAAIHHLPTGSERLKSMREVSRIINDRGRAVVTVWRKWQRRFGLHFLRRHLRHPLGDKAHGELGDIQIPWRSGHGATSISRFYHLFSKRELGKLLSESGLKAVRISKSSKKAGEGSFFASVEKQ